MPLAAYWRRKMNKSLQIVIIMVAIWVVTFVLQILPSEFYSVPMRIWRGTPSCFQTSLANTENLPLTMSVYCKCGTTSTVSPLLLTKIKFSQAEDHTIGGVNVWINQKRKERIDKECRNVSSESGILRGVYLHKRTNLAYCPIAKAGCTFWKRVFLFLHNETALQNVKNPFQIPRMFVHYGKRNKTKVIKGVIKDDKLLANFTRFLFVRNPYTRLWSAYLDKFYLPDFWFTHASRITSNRINTTKEARQCHHDVTFREFLEYVISTHPRILNEHWQPVKYRCDPCQFKPDIIGKQETFEADARHILQQIGLEWVINDLDHDAIVIEELKMLIDYNFALLRYRFYQRCITKTEIARRLFKVFQMNGYIPAKYTVNDILQNMTHSTDVGRFKNLILSMYHKLNSEEKMAIKFQREQSLKEAYSKIPFSVIQGITVVFRTDFNSFGYDMVPPSFHPTL